MRSDAGRRDAGRGDAGRRDAGRRVTSSFGTTNDARPTRNRPGVPRGRCGALRGDAVSSSVGTANDARPTRSRPGVPRGRCGAGGGRMPDHRASVPGFRAGGPACSGMIDDRSISCHSTTPLCIALHPGLGSCAPGRAPDSRRGVDRDSGPSRQGQGSRSAGFQPGATRSAGPHVVSYSLSHALARLP